MEKRLTIQLDNHKVVKIQEQDITLQFSLILSYGAPYDVALAALDEFIVELKDMQRIQIESTKPVVEEAQPEAITPEIVS